MIVFSIDPGNMQSGWCIVDGETMKPQDFGKTDNDELLDSFERLIRVYQVDVVIIEMVACYGMPVGREVFETCVWIGRFTEKAKQLQKDVQYITRTASEIRPSVVGSELCIRDRYESQRRNYSQGFDRQICKTRFKERQGNKEKS